METRYGFRLQRSGTNRILALVLALTLAITAVAPASAQEPAAEPGNETPLYLPSILDNKCYQLRTLSRYGVQLYGATGESTILHNDLVASGASFIRNEISWAGAEPTNTTPDKYNWAGIDSVAAVVGQGCYNMVMTILGNPLWAAPDVEGVIPAENLPEFAEFMGALVERYDGDGVDDAPGSPQILYFELYNEPDAGPAGSMQRWGEHGKEYAAMLKAIYPAMKAANPKVNVVFGGIAYDFFTDTDPENPADNGPFVRKFLDDVLANGAGPYFDIMNYHFYPLFGVNWTDDYLMDGPSLVKKTDAIRAVLQKYGVNKPIIITEMGWHNNAMYPHGSDVLQVRMVVQLYAQSIVAGIPMSTWWPLSDIGGAYLQDSGLVTYADEDTAPVRKPAYTVFQVLTRELANVRFVKRIVEKEWTNNVVYEFYDVANQRTIYVAWTNPTDPTNIWGSKQRPYVDTTTADNIRLDGTNATVYDAFWQVKGTVVDGNDGRTDGRFQIAINGDPVFIVARK
ncbi:MAG: hypothetical protein H6643_13630 [Caldilineaceae bacterium]|nr:hypothetical protein [Caldilineaceae bacterium]